MRCFIAIMELQGIARKPKPFLFLQEKVDQPLYLPKYCLKIGFYYFLSFEDNRNVISGSKISKIKNILKNTQYKYKTLYIPTHDICINECLLLRKW